MEACEFLASGEAEMLTQTIHESVQRYVEVEMIHYIPDYLPPRKKREGGVRVHIRVIPDSKIRLETVETEKD